MGSLILLLSAVVVSIETLLNATTRQVDQTYVHGTAVVDDALLLRRRVGSSLSSTRLRLPGVLAQVLHR